MSYSSFLRASASARVALAVAGLVLLAACGPAQDASPSVERQAAAPAPRAAPTVVLEDVLETTPTHIIGISYPKDLARYPGLAAQAQRYAEQARRQVVEAVRERPAAEAADPAAGPFELSLEFKLKHESPQLVVLAVDGSSYTGGAHGTPMIQRWVWLPREQHLLTAAELFPQEGSWQTISTSVRRQLRDSVSQRLQADSASAAEHASAVRTAGAMIDGGTEAGAQDFAVFEPVMTADGKIGALRFVFPPYQVGTYADGLHTVELPASQLLGMVNPTYRGLFEAA